MIQKTKSSKLRDYLGYLFGKDPQDEWIFTVDKNECRFLNGWRSGASLYINGVEVAKNDDLFAVNPQRTLVEGKLIDDQGNESILSIHMKAITGVKIQIRHNNKPIHDGFLS